jgi:hypothetical protein
MKKTILAGFIAVLAVGCTSITTPDGAKYRNALFAKQFAELGIEKQTGTNYTKVTVKGYRSEAEAVAATFQAGFQQAINGLKVYTGQGATVNSAPAFTQEQLDDAIRRVLIRQSNSTQATVTEVKPK